MAENPGGNELSFERAELAGETVAAGGVVCALCGTAIRNVYFQVGGAIACAPCRGRVVAERAGGSAAGRFARAALFGVGAAILGALLWYGVARLTGYEFSLIAIVIGFLVGTAVRLGSRRRGGWAFQALAMFLTYTSIVSTYIPAIYEAAIEQSEAEFDDGDAESNATEAAAADEIPAAEDAGEAAAETAAASVVVVAERGVPPPIGGVPGLFLGLAALFAIAFAAPFLGGFSNFMGWIILAIGLYEAWKINRREEIAIEGPFRVAGAPPAYAPDVPPPPIAP